MSSLLENLSISPAYGGFVGIASLGSVLLCMALLITLRLAYRRLISTHPYRLAAVVLLNLVAALCIASGLFDIRWLSSDSVSATLLTQTAAAKPTPAYAAKGVVYRLDNKALSANSDAITLLSLYELALIEPDLQQLQVVGDGLSAAEWRALAKALGRPVSVTFVASAPLLGLVDLRWSKRLAPGQYQQVSGRLQDDQRGGARRYRLTLEDPAGGVVGQQDVLPGQHFQFDFVPRAAGQWHYRLALNAIDEAITGRTANPRDFSVEHASSESLITQGLVAFEVQPGPMLRVLIQQSAPSFETRHVKNWLGQAGAQVSLVTQISRGKQITQHVNRGTDIEVFNQSGEQRNELSNDEPLRRRTLHEFDLLIMDGRALTSLVSDDQVYLAQAVSEGLGLFVTVDATLAGQLIDGGNDWLAAFELTEIAAPQTEYLDIPVWPNSQVELSIPLWPARFGRAQGQSLVTGSDGEALIVSQGRGLGVVALSLINTSYQWQIQGQSQVFSHYWQYLMAHISRNSAAPRWLDASITRVDYANEPLSVCAFVAQDKPDVSMVGIDEQKTPLLLAAKRRVSNQRCAPAWPLASGWHQFEIGGQALAPTARQARYVYTHADWQAWQQADKHRATRAMLVSPIAAPLRVARAIDPSIFWWLLIIASTLLWVERWRFRG